MDPTNEYGQFVGAADPNYDPESDPAYMAKRRAMFAATTGVSAPTATPGALPLSGAPSTQPVSKTPPASGGPSTQPVGPTVPSGAGTTGQAPGPPSAPTPYQTNDPLAFLPVSSAANQIAGPSAPSAPTPPVTGSPTTPTAAPTSIPANYSSGSGDTSGTYYYTDPATGQQTRVEGLDDQGNTILEGGQHLSDPSLSAYLNSDAGHAATVSQQQGDQLRTLQHSPDPTISAYYNLTNPTPAQTSAYNNALNGAAPSSAPALPIAAPSAPPTAALPAVPDPASLESGFVTGPPADLPEVPPPKIPLTPLSTGFNTGGPGDPGTGGQTLKLPPTSVPTSATQTTGTGSSVATSTGSSFDPLLGVGDVSPIGRGPASTTSTTGSGTGGGGTSSTGSLSGPGGFSLTPTDPNSALTNQTIGGPSVDRYAQALQEYNDWQQETDPQFQAAMRDANRYSAAAGRIGSGQATNSIGDIETQRENNMRSQRDTFLGNALNASIDDIYKNIGIAQQQQGFQAGQQQTGFNQQVTLQQLAAGLQNQGFSQQVQLQQLMDSEQGQQYAQQLAAMGFNAQQVQQAFANAMQVQQLSDDETGQAFTRALDQFIYGSQGDPSQILAWLAGQYAKPTATAA